MKENLSEENMHPFLKWAGGKTQLLDEIRKYYPFITKNITKYAEPFVGSGAVLFDVLSHYTLKEIYISDVNRELINTYTIIRNNINELVELLTKYQKKYWAMNSSEQKEYYLNF